MVGAFALRAWELYAAWEGEEEGVVGGAGANVGSSEGSHAGSQSNPIVLGDGCAVTVEVAQGSHAFFALPGFSEASASGRLPMLRWEWVVDAKHDETPLTAFSFLRYPRFEGVSSASYFDWYYWPLLSDDDVDFQEHEDGFVELDEHSFR